MKPVKVIKKVAQPHIREQRHELGLLAILIEKHPERAKEFLRRLGESMRAAA